MLSWVFVDPEAQGHKLGSRLLEAGIHAMDERGLKTQFSLVRGDNTASWNMFAKNGYTRPTVLRSLFIGAALSLFSLRGIEFFYIAMAMVAGITALRMVVAYPIARSSGPVRFDAPQGGTPLSVLLALAFGAWWPTFGFFVPQEDIWRDREFARYNGMQAFATWMSLVLVYVGTSLFYPATFNAGPEVFLDIIIVYQVIPFFPFDGMDGAKVLRYSGILYAIGVVLSLSAIVVF